ncbi:DUF4102 domain-containing protein, partial [Pseudomonas syringae]|nr:DUF4102 domain-containing protein [Pseudomonas syringae]
MPPNSTKYPNNKYLQRKNSLNTAVFKRKTSDAFIRSLTDPGKHADGEVHSLYLAVRASSKIGKSPSRFWRFKYRLHDSRFSIGAYPDTSPKEARG